MALKDRDDRRLRVMVIDGCPERARMVERSLTACGHEVVARLADRAGLRERVPEVEPDVVIVDVDSPDCDILEDMHAINREHPRPIVVFAQDGDRRTIETAVRAGVSAYVVDGLSEGRVMPVLEVAIARFEEFQAIRRQLEEARTSLAERKLVERAKGILMRQLQLDEEAAYRAMRNMAMDRNLRLGDLARSLIAASELLAPAHEARREKRAPVRPGMSPG